MKRFLHTALMTTVMVVAAANAMATETKTKTDVKPMHHKHHVAMAQKTTWSEKDVQVLQQSLRDSGFYKGTVTGRWSPTTENALASYQQANGLTVTGSLNDQTVKKLGLHTTAKEKISEVPMMKSKHKKHHKKKPVTLEEKPATPEKK